MSRFSEDPIKSGTVISFPATQPAPSLAPIATYIDEHGHKVTRYPARTAYGALRQGDMVLSNRGK